MTQETKSTEYHPPEVYLERIAREMRTMRELLVQVLNKVVEAESEIPEKMRRFANYFHDIHHIIWTYEEKGLPAPLHLRQEMERCDDRARQVLKELHTDGGVFEKIRREMASDPENRWDHTRLLSKPNGGTHEARQSESQLDWINQGGAAQQGS